MEKPKGRDVKQSVKILYIKDYLCSHANREECVTAQQIVNYLNSQGIRADRKTIFTDIDKLREYYHLDVRMVKGQGYYLDTPQFEPKELRLMVDAVQSSRFITSKEATDITNKIKDLTDIHTRETLNRNSLVVDRIQKKQDTVLDGADDIHMAIYENSKLSFKYFHYDPSASDKKKYSREGEPYEVSPIALYWNNGNYYLLAYLSDKQEYRHFRVDRMEDIQVLFAKREGVEGFNATQYLGNKKAKVFGMYGGRIERVTLQGINKVADQVIDEFGKDLMMVELFDKEHFQVNVVVEISPTFFAWVSTFGKQMQIVNPPSVVEEMKAFVSKLSEMYE